VTAAAQSFRDERLMRRTLSLARRGLFTTSPNPRVGCLLLKDGEMIGQGWHAAAGGPHAEVVALTDSAVDTTGATAYVTLEPCCHTGRTPACVGALIAANIARVVVGMQDPNPLVAGQGIQRLRDAGIDVEVGVCENEAIALNPGFIKRMTHGVPFFWTKVAASLDGRTALESGDSRWITSDAARRDAQDWRARACAILTGIGTVLHDDPKLNARPEQPGARQPLRVLVDSMLQVPERAQFLELGPAIVVCTQDSKKAERLRKTGHEVIVAPADSGHVDLAWLARELGSREINEVHVEAGPTLNAALLSAGLIDEIVLYVAPRLIGPGRPMANLPALAGLESSIDFEFLDVTRIGSDIRLRLGKQ